VLERFTDEALRLLVMAREEARRRLHPSMGTGHLLLALTAQEGTIAAEALLMAGLPSREIRRDVVEVLEERTRPASGAGPFDPHVRGAFKLALRESQTLGDRSIRPEHILLGVLGEAEGDGAVVLLARGADLARLRAEITWLSTPARRSVAPLDSEPFGQGGLRRRMFVALEHLDHLNGEVVALRLVLEDLRERLATIGPEAGCPQAEDPGPPNPVT
jgi:ATP-dependent Clp protease ATP-binding subunit ClpA